MNLIKKIDILKFNFGVIVMLFTFKLKSYRISLVFIFQIVVLMVGIILGKGKQMNKYIVVLISITFLITALYIFLKRRSVYSKFIFIAMIFCFLGDITLAGFIPGGFIFGGGMFAIAHIIFIIGYIRTIRAQNGIVFNKAFFISAVFYYVILIALWIVKLRYMKNSGGLQIGIFAYGICLTTMASLAAALCKNNKKYLKTAVGAVFFIISDSFIGMSHAIKVSYSEAIIWTTYVIALYGIIYGGELCE